METQFYRVHGCGPQLKPAPVQVTVTSQAHDEDGTGGVVLKFAQKEYLDVLGVRLDKLGSTLTSISTKLAAAEKRHLR